MRSSDPAFLERVRILQRALGITGAGVDGYIGHGTLSLIEARILPTIPEAIEPVPAAIEPAASGMVDFRSAKNIATLNEKVRPYFERIVIEGTRIAREMGVGLYVMTGGTRTYAEQDALYAQGRTAGGKRVTNARGGYSNHNFGIAGDFGVFSTRGEYLDGSNPGLASKIHRAVAEWVKANLPIEWGGDWESFPDEPHFQYRTGLSTADMRARVAAGKAIV